MTPLREAAWQHRPSDVDTVDLPDRDYQYGSLLNEPGMADTWLTRLCAGLCAIVGVCFLMLALKEVLTGPQMRLVLDAMLWTVIGIPSALVAAYLLYFGSRAKIE